MKINPHREIGHQYARNREATVFSCGRYLTFYTYNQRCAEEFIKILDKAKQDYKWMSFAQRSDGRFKIIYKIL